jgi:hypothetical protein
LSGNLRVTAPLPEASVVKTGFQYAVSEKSSRLHVGQRRFVGRFGPCHRGSGHFHRARRLAGRRGCHRCSRIIHCLAGGWQRLRLRGLFFLPFKVLLQALVRFVDRDRQIRGVFANAPAIERFEDRVREGSKATPLSTGSSENSTAWAGRCCPPRRC